MKRRILPLLLIFCLLLCGCGADGLRRSYETFSADLAEKDCLSFQASLIAAYPNRSAEFTLAYRLEGDQQRVTVLSPGRISGVSAHTAMGSTTLEFDGLILDTGDLDQRGLSPMSALPLLVDALRSGHADAFWTEDSMTAVQILYDDHTAVQVRFDEDMRPVRAELISDGVVTVECEIENWS